MRSKSCLQSRWTLVWLVHEGVQGIPLSGSDIYLGHRFADSFFISWLIYSFIQLKFYWRPTRYLLGIVFKSWKYWGEQSKISNLMREGYFLYGCLFVYWLGCVCLLEMEKKHLDTISGRDHCCKENQSRVRKGDDWYLTSVAGEDIWWDEIGTEAKEVRLRALQVLKSMEQFQEGPEAGWAGCVSRAHRAMKRPVWLEQSGGGMRVERWGGELVVELMRLNHSIL